MGLLERLASWFEAPAPELYRCADCHSRYVDAHAACPECGGAVDPAGYAPELTHYWEPL